MAIYKRRRCPTRGCKFEAQDATQLKSLPRCPKCGAETYYAKGWYVEIRINGPKGPQKLKKSCASKAEAQTYETDMLSKRDKGEVIDKTKDTSFTNAVKVFFDYIDAEEKKGNLASGTTTPYKYNTNLHLLPYFKKTPLEAIDLDTVEDFIEHMEQKPVIQPRTGKPMKGREGYAPATINRCLAALSRIMSVAVKKRLIKHNQLDGMSLLNENNERDRFLSHEEIDRLLAECKKPRPCVHRKGEEGDSVIPHLYIATLIGLNTGLRIEGVLTLRWEEIDFRRNEIVKTVKHRRSAGPKVVRVPMSPALREGLLAWKKERGVRDVPPPTGYVIESHKNEGDHLRVSSNIGFTKVCKDAGLGHFTFHQLRHTFCTHFLEQHPDKIEVLQRIVGHSSSYMTRRYAHITDRAKHQAMESFCIGGETTVQNGGRWGANGGRG